jgi:hypothetical protein
LHLTQLKFFEVHFLYLMYDSNPNNLGLNNRLGLLGDYLKQVQKELKDLEEALQLQTEQMRVAKIEFFLNLF